MSLLSESSVPRVATDRASKRSWMRCSNSCVLGQRLARALAVGRQGLRGLRELCPEGRQRVRQLLARQRGLGLALGQALLELGLERAERSQQLSAAGARFAHGLAQAFVDGAAQRLQLALRGLREAAELLAQRLHRAIIARHGQPGGLGHALQRLQPGVPVGRPIHVRAAQQDDGQQNHHNGQCGQQDKGVGSQNAVTILLIAASAYPSSGSRKFD